ncbi:MAG: substrate-binding domain-containing protein [Fimbriimonadaceae bacterium]|nr:substrate-binding domain-containing protein [Fimbriimonadaceae bacterium]
MRRLALISVLLAGCTPQATEPVVRPPSEMPSPTSQTTAPPGAGPKVIGLSVLTMDNPFFKDIADSLAAAAQPQGYTVEAVSGDFDVAKQKNQVQDFIVKKVAAIVLCPCDSKAIGASIEDANAAGIPVFTADIACLDPEAKVVSHIATDNLQGGRLAADAVVEALGGKGQVAILDHPVVESVMLRTKGFRARLAELNKQPGNKVEIVATLPGGGDKAKSLAAAQDLLTAHPDLDAIFAINDPSALGARAALENAQKADQVKIIGFDGQLEGKQAIAAGKLYADPIQFPKEIGAKTWAVIQQYFNGEQPPREVLIPTRLYRQADAQGDPELAAK